jgi:beta-glucosidase
MSAMPAGEQDGGSLQFPDGFGWGVATASYQNEGAVAEGGRAPSIWDTFAHTPGAIVDGTTGDIACDHYRRYREDVDLMADLGIGYYRFSLAWPRLQPRGRGTLNAAGVDFYERLVETLLERDIEPWVTLYHWDLPQALQDAGGWPERSTAQRFAEYASAVYERLADRVRYWTTFNEPWVAAFAGYASGMHAPGIRDAGAALRSAHHMMLGHGLALRAIREHADPRSRFGVTLILQPVLPESQEPQDVAVARRLDLMANRIFLDPLLCGRYPADYREAVSGVTDSSFIEPGDEEIIGAPLDVLGVNFYFRHLVRRGEAQEHLLPFVACEDVEVLSRGLPRTAAGWEIDPNGLHDLLTRLHRDYPSIPIYVTENGAAFDDGPVVDGSLPDPQRIEYLDAHFRAAHRAIADGVDLRGYFVWTLMDNWEWAQGFTNKYGLYHVDFETQARTPKDSARWFSGVTRRNGLAPITASL